MIQPHTMLMISVNHHRDVFRHLELRLDTTESSHVSMRFWLRGYCRSNEDCWHDGNGYNLEEAFLALRDDYLTVHK